MKNTPYFIVTMVFIMVHLNVLSQSKYGNATMDELTMTTYPNDTTAAAVILLKKGETIFTYNNTNGFQFAYTLQTRIKILKEEGLNWCNQEVSYYESSNASKEIITGLSGTVYNLVDNKIVKTKLSKEHIFEEHANNKWKLKKFTLQGAKVGSVIEFKYTITSEFFYQLREFDFQASIPIVYASYEAIIPEYYKYNINTQGYESIKGDKKQISQSLPIMYRDYNGNMRSEVVSHGSEKIFFEGKDIPAIKSEPNLWTLNDYKSRVSFELQSTQFPHETVKSYTKTWKDIDEGLLKSEDFGDNLKKKGLFKKEFEKVESNLENARIILNHIKSNVSWNEKSAFYPYGLNDALKKGLGNSADMNFLLINALKSGGFDAFPVILSTRGNGRIPLTHPSFTALDYTIAGIKIDTTMYFVDASDKYGDWNILPEKCMVPQARILKENASSWVDLSLPSAGMSMSVIQHEFIDSQYISKVTKRKKGNEAYDFRKSYVEYKDSTEYLEKLASSLSGEIEDHKITNLNNTAEELTQAYTLKKPQLMEDEFLYINPMYEKHLSENPFKNEERKFPINFKYPTSYIHIATIQIPKGYAVEELPRSEKIALENNGLSLNYRVGINDDKINIHYQFVLRNILFLPQEYEILKEFFAKVALKNSEQIVLKKIN